MTKESVLTKFNCKIEELPFICRFALTLGRRDMSDFMAFSPIFNADYFDRFEVKINAAENLVSPQTETEELKKITKNLYGIFDGLIDPINKVRGYLHLAGESVGISDKNFGLSPLAQKIRSRDAEGVRQNLVHVNRNIQKFMSELTTVGLNAEIVNHLTAAVAPITQNNQKQFEISSQRRETVRKNIEKLNELYLNLIEFTKVGSIIYKASDPDKANEYTFVNLKKKVRIITNVKPEPEVTKTKDEE
ncbi:MAG: hypothetical protein LBD59_12425 [Prevotellaceae bacterium]|jgi:hypothetical protein|nr:hypothetical protein [Prevotellaceae bacterium]